MDINTFSFQDLARQMDAKGHRLFLQDDKPYNLNLIGIRTAENIPDVFNDWFIMLWKYRGTINMVRHQVTTDPGLFYLTGAMMSKKGTAILKPGQYHKMLCYGYHKGYRAFQQVAPCTVWRDFNRDGQMNPVEGIEETGIFSINVHRGKAIGQTEKVGPYSAGCTVHANASEFAVAMAIAKEAVLYWPNQFTYTLLEEKSFV